MCIATISVCLHLQTKLLSLIMGKVGVVTNKQDINNASAISVCNLSRHDSIQFLTMHNWFTTLN